MFSSAYLNANPGRYPMLHLKDMNSSGEIVGLGQGVLDFRRILAAARTAGTTTVFFLNTIGRLIRSKRRPRPSMCSSGYPPTPARHNTSAFTGEARHGPLLV